MPYHPIVRKDLEKYLPNFDPTADPQVGEWVLVSPHRRAAIVDPLIHMSMQQKLQPMYPFLDEACLTAAAPPDAVLDPTAGSAAAPTDPCRVFPTIEEVRKKYRRHRHHGCMPGDRGGKTGTVNEKQEEMEEEDDDTMLYLNPRALLLTPCAPAVFGGSDFIEGLDKDTGRVVFVHWRTGEVRSDTAALQPRPIPEWAEEVAEKAMAEFESWQRLQIVTSCAQKKEEDDSDAPPLQRVRIQ
ncbi:hypothetical protein DQ04_02031080 [Trypanosoma grayi]|uniref:hypothetical protein n=1 Tax=Trypanosoma grayi TaxID=71804 RepID=UPI0004F48420|nr:hypothetical protein DQ04_02031080 [Trypanosoma grayi]KEG12066.1 hypothetical protein DQ04_02031080 [Trypanosoma grayi]